MQGSSDSCSFCNKTAILACSRCIEPYCSQHCQLKDWFRHRNFCKSIPPLVRLSEAKSWCNDVTNSSCDLNASLDAETIEMLNFARGGCSRAASPAEKSFKAKIPDAEQMKRIREALPPAPLKNPDLGIVCKQLVNPLPRTISTATLEPALDAMKWKETVNFREIPRKEVEVTVHKYDPLKKEAWLILTKDKPHCNALMNDLNSMAKSLQTVSPDLIRPGQMYAVQFTEKLYARGEVMIVNEDGTITTRLIDYGDLLTMTASKLRIPPAEMLAKPAFAFRVTFRDSRDRHQHQLLMVNFTSAITDDIQLVETCDMSCYPAIEMIVDEKITFFEGKVCTVLDREWYIIKLHFSNDAVLAIKPEDLKNSAKFESTSQVMKGQMILVEESGQSSKRGIVIEQDPRSSVAVVFLCDVGVIKLISLPKKIKLIPYFFAIFPPRALFMHIEDIATKNTKEFLDTLCNADVKFTFKIGQFQPKSISVPAEMCHSNTVVANVKLFNTAPDLASYGLPYWSIVTPSKLPVKILNANFTETAVDVVIHSSDNLFHVKKILDRCEEELLSAVPNVNEFIVAPLQNNSTIRGIVKEVLTRNLVKVEDLDSGTALELDWKTLKKCSAIIKNAPVYKMTVSLRDLPAFKASDMPYVKAFFDLGHLKRRELILFYDGHPLNGVQLNLSHQENSTVINKLTEFVKKMTDEESKKLADELKLKLELEKKVQAEVRAKEEELKRAEAAAIAAAKAADEAAKAAAESEKAKKALADLRAAKLNAAVQGAASKKPGPVPISSEILFEDLKLQKLPAGKTCELLILDTLPAKKMLSVCKYSVENLTFVQEIIDMVQAYIESSKPKRGHKPEIREMCLALYAEDGSWYRAVCVDRPDADVFKVNLIDFGTITDVSPDKITRFPENLMKPEPRTHLAHVKGMTEAQIKTIEIFSQKNFQILSCDGGSCEISPA